MKIRSFPFQRKTLKPRRETLNPRRKTLNPRRKTLNPEGLWSQPAASLLLLSPRSRGQEVHNNKFKSLSSKNNSKKVELLEIQTSARCRTLLNRTARPTGCPGKAGGNLSQPKFYLKVNFNISKSEKRNEVQVFRGRSRQTQHRQTTAAAPRPKATRRAAKAPPKNKTLILKMTNL